MGKDSEPFLIRHGITKNEYAIIHTWLRRKYGSANRCENENCESKSKLYQWALVKGASYKKDRSCFMMLCISCHKRYDWKDEFADKHRGKIMSKETREKLRLASTGVVKTEETKRKLSIANSGANNPMYGVRITGENHYWWGKNHSEVSRRLMLSKHAKVSKEQVSEIRQLVSSGEKQKAVALKYGISRASVCRIIKNKRYKLW